MPLCTGGPKEKLGFPKEKLRFPKGKLWFPKERLGFPKEQLGFRMEKLGFPKAKLEFNIAAARAVDREFNYNFCSNLGGGRRGGCAVEFVKRLCTQKH